MKTIIRACVPVLAAALLSSACAGTRAAAARKAAAEAAARKAEAPTETGRVVDAEPDVRDMNLREVAELKTVHFAYDSDRLDEGSRATLKANAAFLKAHPAVKIQVSGHCDQRGTVAYNLALGQRRARSVRDYYKALGVVADRIATISWGREHLLCDESGDACWARNRRAETLEAVGAAVAEEPR